MAKVAIKSEKLTPFGGIFSIMEQFDSKLSSVIDSTLGMNCLLSTGQLKEGEGHDVDFDHQFIEAEKFDAKPTYKKFLGYRPGVAVIGDLFISAPTAAVRSTMISLRSEGGRRRNLVALSLN